MTDIDDAYLDMANDFLAYDNRIKQLNKEKKEITKEINDLKEKLARFMKRENLEKIETDQGTLVLKESKSKPSTVSKKVLKEQYESSLNGGVDPSKPDEMTEHIFNSLPDKTSVNIKQERKRKRRKKDDGKFELK